MTRGKLDGVVLPVGDIQTMEDFYTSILGPLGYEGPDIDYTNNFVRYCNRNIHHFSLSSAKRPRRMEKRVKNENFVPTRQDREIHSPIQTRLGIRGGAGEQLSPQTPKGPSQESSPKTPKGPSQDTNPETPKEAPKNRDGNYIPPEGMGYSAQRPGKRGRRGKKRGKKKPEEGGDDSRDSGDDNEASTPDTTKDISKDSSFETKPKSNTSSVSKPKESTAATPGRDSKPEGKSKHEDKRSEYKESESPRSKSAWQDRGDRGRQSPRGSGYPRSSSRGSSDRARGSPSRSRGSSFRTSSSKKPWIAPLDIVSDDIGDGHPGSRDLTSQGQSPQSSSSQKLPANTQRPSLAKESSSQSQKSGDRSKLESKPRHPPVPIQGSIQSIPPFTGKWADEENEDWNADSIPPLSKQKGPLPAHAVISAQSEPRLAVDEFKLKASDSPIEGGNTPRGGAMLSKQQKKVLESEKLMEGRRSAEPEDRVRPISKVVPKDSKRTADRPIYIPPGKRGPSSENPASPETPGSSTTRHHRRSRTASVTAEDASNIPPREALKDVVALPAGVADSLKWGGTSTTGESQSSTATPAEVTRQEVEANPPAAEKQEESAPGPVEIVLDSAKNPGMPEGPKDVGPSVIDMEDTPGLHRVPGMSLEEQLNWEALCTRLPLDMIKRDPEEEARIKEIEDEFDGKMSFGLGASRWATEGAESDRLPLSPSQRQANKDGRKKPENLSPTAQEFVPASKQPSQPASTSKPTPTQNPAPKQPPHLSTTAAAKQSSSDESGRKDRGPGDGNSKASTSQKATGADDKDRKDSGKKELPKKDAGNDKNPPGNNDKKNEKKDNDNEDEEHRKKEEAEKRRKEEERIKQLEEEERRRKEQAENRRKEDERRKEQKEKRRKEEKKNDQDTKEAPQSKPLQQQGDGKRGNRRRSPTKNTPKPKTTQQIPLSEQQQAAAARWSPGAIAQSDAALAAQRRKEKEEREAEGLSSAGPNIEENYRKVEVKDSGERILAEKPKTTFIPATNEGDKKNKDEEKLPPPPSKKIRTPSTEKVVSPEKLDEFPALPPARKDPLEDKKILPLKLPQILTPGSKSATPAKPNPPAPETSSTPTASEMSSKKPSGEKNKDGRVEDQPAPSEQTLGQGQHTKPKADNKEPKVDDKQTPDPGQPTKPKTDDKKPTDDDESLSKTTKKLEPVTVPSSSATDHPAVGTHQKKQDKPKTTPTPKPSKESKPKDDKKDTGEDVLSKSTPYRSTAGISENILVDAPASPAKKDESDLAPPKAKERVQGTISDTFLSPLSRIFSFSAAQSADDTKPAESEASNKATRAEERVEREEPAKSPSEPARLEDGARNFSETEKPASSPRPSFTRRRSSSRTQIPGGFNPEILTKVPLDFKFAPSRHSPTATDPSIRRSSSAHINPAGEVELPPVRHSSYIDPISEPRDAAVLQSPLPETASQGARPKLKPRLKKVIPSSITTATTPKSSPIFETSQDNKPQPTPQQSTPPPSLPVEDFWPKMKALQRDAEKLPEDFRNLENTGNQNHWQKLGLESKQLLDEVNKLRVDAAEKRQSAKQVVERYRNLEGWFKDLQLELDGSLIISSDEDEPTISSTFSAPFSTASPTYSPTYSPTNPQTPVVHPSSAVTPSTYLQTPVAQSPSSAPPQPAKAPISSPVFPPTTPPSQNPATASSSSPRQPSASPTPSTAGRAPSSSPTSLSPASAARIAKEREMANVRRRKDEDENRAVDAEIARLKEELINSEKKRKENEKAEKAREAEAPRSGEAPKREDAHKQEDAQKQAQDEAAAAEAERQIQKAAEQARERKHQEEVAAAEKAKKEAADREKVAQEKAAAAEKEKEEAVKRAKLEAAEQERKTREEAEMVRKKQEENRKAAFEIREKTRKKKELLDTQFKEFQDKQLEQERHQKELEKAKHEKEKFLEKGETLGRDTEGLKKEEKQLEEKAEGDKLSEEKTPEQGRSEEEERREKQEQRESLWQVKEQKRAEAEEKRRRQSEIQKQDEENRRRQREGRRQFMIQTIEEMNDHRRVAIGTGKKTALEAFEDHLVEVKSLLKEANPFGSRQNEDHVELLKAEKTLTEDKLKELREQEERNRRDEEFRKKQEAEKLRLEEEQRAAEQRKREEEQQRKKEEERREEEEREREADEQRQADEERRRTDEDEKDTERKKVEEEKEAERQLAIQYARYLDIPIDEGSHFKDIMIAIATEQGRLPVEVEEEFWKLHEEEYVGQKKNDKQRSEAELLGEEDAELAQRLQLEEYGVTAEDFEAEEAPEGKGKEKEKAKGETFPESSVTPTDELERINEKEQKDIALAIERSRAEQAFLAKKQRRSASSRWSKLSQPFRNDLYEQEPRKPVAVQRGPSWFSPSPHPTILEEEDDDDSGTYTGGEDEFSAGENSEQTDTSSGDDTTSTDSSATESTFPLWTPPGQRYSPATESTSPLDTLSGEDTTPTDSPTTANTSPLWTPPGQTYSPATEGTFPLDTLPAVTTTEQMWTQPHGIEPGRRNIFPPRPTGSQGTTNIITPDDASDKSGSTIRGWEPRDGDTKSLESEETDLQSNQPQTLRLVPPAAQRPPPRRLQSVKSTKPTLSLHPSGPSTKARPGTRQPSQLLFSAVNSTEIQEVHRRATQKGGRVITQPQLGDLLPPWNKKKVHHGTIEDPEGNLVTVWCEPIFGTLAPALTNALSVVWVVVGLLLAAALSGLFDENVTVGNDKWVTLSSSMPDGKWF